MADASAEPAKPERKGNHGRRAAVRDFYGSVLDAAQRIELQEAADVEGIDAEIAVLRMELREVLKREPKNLPLMLRGIELLVKAVSARYRLSKQAEEDLSESIAGVVRGVGGLLIPEAFEHEHGA